MKLKKRSFTLIEIVLCIALLSLIGGLLTYKGKDLISKAQKDSEISKIKKTLDLTQSLALSYHADIDVTFTLESKDQLVIDISSDEEAVQEALKPFCKQKFSHIDSLNFDDEKLQINHPISFVFSGTGWLFPNKHLFINNKKMFINK